MRSGGEGNYGCELWRADEVIVDMTDNEFKELGEESRKTGTERVYSETRRIESRVSPSG